MEFVRHLFFAHFFPTLYVRYICIKYFINILILIQNKRVFFVCITSRCRICMTINGNASCICYIWMWNKVKCIVEQSEWTENVFACAMVCNREIYGSFIFKFKAVCSLRVKKIAIHFWGNESNNVLISYSRARKNYVIQINDDVCNWWFM